LVAVRTVEPRLRLDIRYATSNNFLGRPVYPVAAAYLQRPAALALARAHARLAVTGYGIVVFDGYRPWSVTRLFWESVPPSQRDYVADPAKGSRHNRGCAVDCSLIDLHTGEPVDMTSAYDEPTVRAHADFAGGTPAQRHARDLLRAAMEAEGFTVLPNEWWHFDHQDWRRYPVLDIPLERLGRRRTQ
jgi:D-alanyl-D-alanine dipeptidase